MAKILSKMDILNCNDLKTETISVPEWGGDVIVKALSGRERDDYESSLYQMRGQNVQINLKNTRALLVSLSVVDESGNRIFNKADLDALGAKSSAALDRVATVAARLSGLSKDDEKRLVNNLKNE